MTQIYKCIHKLIEIINTESISGGRKNVLITTLIIIIVLLCNNIKSFII